MNRLRNKRDVLLLLLMAVGAMTGYAQSNCFTYEDEGKTIITGLTSDGQYATSLIIPATVTTVRSSAFRFADSGLTNLIISGGNPTFESNLFGGNANTLTRIDMGSEMSVEKMMALMTSIGGPQGTVVAGGFSGTPDTSNATWNAVSWTGLSSITLPAELVASQPFGSADVYGRFTIDKEIISFCTCATFEDVDNGSNMLFYVANSIEDRYIQINRVRYIAANQGVLIHRTGSSSGYCDLPRVNGIPQAHNDNGFYASNMLVGVTEATPIGKTDGDKTNLVLKDGAFHPTSGGTVKANRAYLQISTSLLPVDGARLEISFPDEEAGIGSLTPAPTPKDEGSMKGNEAVYDLQGRKVHSPLQKGIYIVNGKLRIIK